MEIGAEIRNANGGLIRKVPFRRCNSLLKQFIQLLAVCLLPSPITIKDTGGTNRLVYWSATNFKVSATTESTFGVVIGTGETPVTMADYQLETPLTAGIGFQTVVVAVENPDAETWRVAISRGFMNNTGAQVTIKEAALYGYMSDQYRGCWDRTLYEVAFQAGETLTLTYRITVAL